MAHSGIEVLFQGKNFLRLMGGLWTSVWIAGVSLGFGLLLGTFLGVLRTLKNAVLRVVLRLYLEFFRIVPTIVLLFLVYYILPRQFHVEVSAEWMAVLAFSLWVSAEFSDIVRGALESVPKHQREAGLALGLTKGQLFVHVLMPQAFMLELPACDARRQNDVLADDHQRDGRHQRWSADHRGKQSAISKRSFLDLRIYFHAVFHR